ncbi:major facilitator family multidrug efflux transporter [Natrinema pellirubrum DSM 15624]|uniref:Arabinose efflux permease family protein n=1 Tax=Natrinema pellirubrum (strain DSM 15624 / CIP 106293 / JCM 10476 / NCIMB 786 / 157) TaxID=797303 RepID=L0JNK3_NATP1|nr:MFS transporter [Natrinema pellirubrum]AGB31946.1 arabinose efflux permease family protein [Natrinema pellirubrum DSM 15624]ELY77887.1 major facilitator family multidrug efflux transporter [Natrinema pellirubrum DSM 15624]
MATSTQRRRTLWVVVAAATLTVMAGAILGPIVPQIRDELGVSGSAAGLIITTHGGVIVLASPVVGALVDRVGPRRPLVGGLFVYGLGGGAGLLVDSFLPLLASRVVLGLGTAAVYTSVTVLIYDLYEGQAMERALGYRSSANSAGAAVWPLVGGAAGSLAWNAPFGIYLVAVPLGLLAAATVPEVGASSGDDETAANGSGRADGAERGGGGVLAVFRDRPALPLVYLLYFGANALLYVIVVYYPQLLSGIGVTSSLRISLYLAANGAAGGVSAIAYDRLLGYADRSTLVFAAFVLWASGLATATVVDTAVGAAVPVVLFGLGIGLVFPSTFAWVEALVPPDRQGQFSSYIASVGYTGQFLSPVLFGALVPLAGVDGVFAAAAAIAGIAAVGLGSSRLRDASS